MIETGMPSLNMHYMHFQIRKQTNFINFTKPMDCFRRLWI